MILIEVDYCVYDRVEKYLSCQYDVNNRNELQFILLIVFLLNLRITFVTYFTELYLLCFKYFLIIIIIPFSNISCFLSLLSYLLYHTHRNINKIYSPFIYISVIIKVYSLHQTHVTWRVLW